MKQQFRIAAADTFKTYVFDNNRKAVPASALLTVYKPGSTDKLLDAVAMTVAADGLLSYSLTSVHNAELGENYKGEVSYVLASLTHTFALFYDVVRSKLVKVITDADLEAELPQIKEKNWRVRGVAASGSATTIVDTGLKKHDDDFFTGGLAYSPSKDETREITDFVSSTGTVTTEPFSGAIATGEKYVLMRSYTTEIQRAFEKLEDNLRKKGKRPHLILDPYDLREPHILMSVAEVCKGLATDGDNTFWWDMWKAYENKADIAFGSLNLKYDATNDGTISGEELGRRMSAIKVRF